MRQARVLVAGIGNIFLGDDAFGVVVVQKLSKRKLANGVRVVDFGIRGFDLACAMLDGYDRVILVDSAARGLAPGMLSVIEPDAMLANDWSVEPHGLNPDEAFRLARELGGPLPQIRIVGCEPQSFAPSECIRLSGRVGAAVEGAIELIESLIEESVKQKPEAVVQCTS